MRNTMPILTPAAHTKKDDQLDMKIGPDTKLEGGESILVYGKDRDLQRGLNLGNKRFHSD